MRKNPISKQEIEKVDIIIDDIKNGKLIINHPLQRYSKQWGAEQKGNLIRRVLRDGRFLPILICTQYDEYGCEVRYLIDGVQRMTTFEDYMNDGFAISKNTIDYIVDYDGIVYETKTNSSGKVLLKRDKMKNLIPVLDENGNVQRRVQSLDVRGLKFSELPPELQEKISRYKVSVELKLECTDEDIQVEILDYNSGTKMNDAQIGKNRLGAEFAKIVIELSNHPFIKNKCGFTPDNRTKGVIDRAINEALMLVNFGADNWVVSHKDLCRKLSNWLTTEHTDKMKCMLDELNEIISEEKEIKEYLTLKEFFVVLANYHYFRDCGYATECYAKFLHEFITETSYIKNLPTGETDEDGEDVYDSFRNVYMQGSKQKGSIEERLTTMNKMLEEYLAENCFDMKGDILNEDISTEEYSLDAAPVELQEFAQNFIDDSTAIRCLMLSTDNPYCSFEENKLQKMVEWYRRDGKKEMLDDCLFYKTIAIDEGIAEDDDDLPFYIYGIKYIEKNGLEINTDKWLSYVQNVEFSKGINDESDNVVALKAIAVVKNIRDYEAAHGNVCA